MAGVHVIGVDSSAGMLAVCRSAREAGVAERLDLRLGDLRRPPVDERVPLVTCPFRAYLHLATDEERLEALRARAALLEPGGRLVFDVFAPSQEDVEETHGRWIEREPGIDERADWDLERADADALGARRGRRVDDGALVARARAVARAARRSGLRGRRVLRLVRPAGRTREAKTRVWIAHDSANSEKFSARRLLHSRSRTP